MSLWDNILKQSGKSHDKKKKIKDKLLDCSNSDIILTKKGLSISTIINPLTPFINGVFVFDPIFIISYV